MLSGSNGHVANGKISKELGVSNLSEPTDAQKHDDILNLPGKDGILILAFSVFMLAVINGADMDPVMSLVARHTDPKED